MLGRVFFGKNGGRAASGVVAEKNYFFLCVRFSNTAIGNRFMVSFFLSTLRGTYKQKKIR
jgi:hypothetical protein